MTINAVHSFAMEVMYHKLIPEYSKEQLKNF